MPVKKVPAPVLPDPYPTAVLVSEAVERRRDIYVVTMQNETFILRLALGWTDKFHKVVRGQVVTNDGGTPRMFSIADSMIVPGEGLTLISRGRRETHRVREASLSCAATSPDTSEE